jgi:hypothetical protein
MEQGFRASVRLAKSLNAGNKFEIYILQKILPAVLAVHSSHMTHGAVEVQQ